jgi:hypothetical protein
MYVESFTIQGWKRYECPECWCIYRTRFERRCSGCGGTTEQAHENAVRDALRPFLNESEKNPCPTCGLLPARATAPQRFSTQASVFGVAFFGLFIPMLIAAASGVSRPAVALVLAVVAAGATAGHWLTARGDPNRDREALKQRAAWMIKREKMSVLREGNDDAEPTPPAYTAKHTGRLMTALAAAPLAALAAILHVVMGPSPAVWWTLAGLASLVFLSASLSLVLIENAAQKNAGAAVVERLDGKDGEVVLLTDDPDNPIPPPPPPPAPPIDKPWKRG